MNSGFSNLDTLRKHILAPSQKGDKSFDTMILAIGLGMAARIGRHCNRTFMRTVDLKEVQPGDRLNYLLSCFPVEQVTLIELKLDETDGFIEQWPNAPEGVSGSYIDTIDLANGMIHLPEENEIFEQTSQIRFTYTGGYWWEQLEPDDANYPSAMPGTAAALPDDLKLAWLLQCQQVWAARDKLGLGMIDKPEAQENLSALKLSSLVREMLQSFVRMQMV